MIINVQDIVVYILILTIKFINCVNDSNKTPHLMHSFVSIRIQPDMFRFKKKFVNLNASEPLAIAKITHNLHAELKLMMERIFISHSGIYS